LAVGAVVGAGVFGAGGRATDAVSLACGDTITADTTLHADLLDCPNSGIIIAGDDITLDLNGHTIDGDGVPVADCPEEAICDVGVVNSDGHDGLVITGGAIRQFGVGVFAAGGAAENRLQDLTASINTDFGIIVVESTDTVIARTAMPDNGTSGLILADSRRAVVAGNSVSGSHGYAMNFFGVYASSINGNRMDGNDHGIQMTAGSSHNTIRRNVVSHGGGSSIDIGGEDVTANRVVHNRLRDNGDGIVLGNTRRHRGPPQRRDRYRLLRLPRRRRLRDHSRRRQKDHLGPQRRQRRPGPGHLRDIARMANRCGRQRRLPQRCQQQAQRRDPHRKRGDKDHPQAKHRDPQRRRRHRRRRARSDADPKQRQP
jgi:hypothetical protein